MNITKILVSIYIVKSILVVVAVFMDIYWLKYFLKPMILPSLFFYYLVTKKEKISYVLMLLLLLNYISDMIEISNYSFKGDVVIAMNFIANVILSYFFIRDYFIVKHKTSKNKIQFFVFLIGFLLMTYFFLTLIPNLNLLKLIYYVLYGFILSLMATVTIQSYSLSHTLRSFYSVIVSMAFVITDTFYVIYFFYLPMKVFLVFNLAAQFGSYYYLVNYFSASENISKRDDG